MNCLLIMIICYIASVCSVDKLCDQTKSCIGQSLNFTGRTGIYGYKAAFGPSTSYSGRGSIICGASYSCHTMQYVIPTTINNEHSTISCPASNSCSNTTLANTSDLTCHGSDSCSFSNISGINNGMQCHGYHSCANTYISNTPKIYARGAFSLYKSIIDATQSISIWLTGRLAGYGAQLTCRAGHTCDIYCQGYDSCYMFYTDCIGTCVIHSNLMTQRPINDTQFNKIPINLTSHKLFDTEIMELNTDALCVQEDWNFDDHGEGYTQLTAVTTETISICCRGRGACLGSQNIEYQTSTKNNLICSGQDACRFSNMRNIDTVFCEGVRACREAPLRSIHSLYCTGSGSCKHSTMVNISYVICHAAESCMNASFSSGGSDINIYLNGYMAGQNLTIHCNEDDTCTIYCKGYSSCGTPTWNCEENAICIMTTSDAPTVHPTEHPIVQPTVQPTNSITYSYTTLGTVYKMDSNGNDNDDDDAIYVIVLISGSCVILVSIGLLICCCIYSRRKATVSSNDVRDETDESQHEHEHNHMDQKAINMMRFAARYEHTQHKVKMTQDEPQQTNMGHNDETTKGDIIHDHSNALDVQYWLESVVGLHQYYTNFMSYGYESMAIVSAIVDVKELIEIGIELEAHQNKIFKAIQDLNAPGSDELFLTGSMEGGGMRVTIEGE
eukprot:65710_1